MMKLNLEMMKLNHLRTSTQLKLQCFALQHQLKIKTLEFANRRAQLDLCIQAPDEVGKIADHYKKASSSDDLFVKKFVCTSYLNLAKFESLC
jgi:hypothetical protein